MVTTHELFILYEYTRNLQTMTLTHEVIHIIRMYQKSRYNLNVVAALFVLYSAILAFTLAVKYSDTTAVKVFVRGWEIFVPSLVRVPVLYCTIAFGTWLGTEADFHMQTVCFLGPKMQHIENTRCFELRSHHCHQRLMFPMITIFTS
jgi:hypothetical protein